MSRFHLLYIFLYIFPLTYFLEGRNVSYKTTKGYYVSLFKYDVKLLYCIVLWNHAITKTPL